MNQPLIEAAAPSERDRALYELVSLRGRSYDDAAHQFDLSEREAREIVRRTERAIAQERAAEAGASAARELHRMRLEILFEEAQSAWHASKHDQITQRTKTKEGPPDALGMREPQVERTVTQKSQTGNQRYLDVARRISCDILTVELRMEEVKNEAAAKTLRPLTMEERMTKLTEFFAEVERRQLEWPEPEARGAPATCAAESGATMNDQHRARDRVERLRT